MDVGDIRRVLILGSGTVGRQIGWQFATHGYDVTFFDVSEQALVDARMALAEFSREFVENQRQTVEQVEQARRRVFFESNPETASLEADLLIESVPEDPKLKRRVLAQFNELCPSKTIFTTNTSDLLPSTLASATGRPDRFCAFHFHQRVWDQNVVDVMPHQGTSPDVVDLLRQLARRIDQIPIVLTREHAGYVFNAMLNSVLRTAVELVVEGVTSYEEVDRAWMGITKMPVGPFGILDLVGIDLAYDVTVHTAGPLAFLPKVRKGLRIFEDKIEAGHLGVKTGKGFYEYPNPAFSQPEFLEGT